MAAYLALSLAAGVLVAGVPGVAASSSFPAPVWVRHQVSGAVPTYAVTEPGYSPSLPAGSPGLTLRSAAVRGSFTIPLASLIGRSSWPSGVGLRAATTETSLTLWATGASRRPLQEAVVTAHSGFFTVRFGGQLGGPPGLKPASFSTGRVGLAMASITGGFTPDPRFSPLTRTPAVQLGPIPVAPYTAPFSPPPFDVELATPVGWVGIGLLRVPNATQLDVSSRGQVMVNHPLSVLARIRDQGAGGRISAPRVAGDSAAVGTWLQFPEFVVTMASNWLTGLSAYHDALASFGAATVAAAPGPARAGGRGPWWTPGASSW